MYTLPENELKPVLLNERERMGLATLWNWTLLVALMALKVTDTSPVSDMTQLLRESDIQTQLEQLDILVRKVAGDTDETAPLPSIMDVAPKAEAIKNQLSEIDELMQRMMDLTNCSGRPLTDDSKEIMCGA